MPLSILPLLEFLPLGQVVPQGASCWFVMLHYVGKDFHLNWWHGFVTLCESKRGPVDILTVTGYAHGTAESFSAHASFQLLSFFFSILSRV